MMTHERAQLARTETRSWTARRRQPESVHQYLVPEDVLQTNYESNYLQLVWYFVLTIMPTWSEPTYL